MKVLVTGATGFIGRALCTFLHSRGFIVRAAVRSAIAAGSGMECVQIGELGPATQWSAALSGIDAVVHVAGAAHVLGEIRADEITRLREANVEATVCLARAAARAGVRRLVFISSAKVHGEQSVDRPWTEQDEPAPQDPYTSSKWEAEQSLNLVARSTHLEVTILRPPLVYGAGVKANFLRLLRAVDRSWPIPLGAIRNRRSLIYIGNLADAIATALRHPGARNRTYLVADGKDVSTPELVRQIAAALGRQARLVSVPVWLLRLGTVVLGRRADFDRLAADFAVDASALRRELGWAPPYGLEQGIRLTAQWYLKEGRQAHG